MNKSADEQWITRAEACAIFGVATWTWTSLVQAGRVPGGRLGRTSSGRRCQFYPLNELRRLKAQWDQEKEQLAQQLEPCPDPDRPGVWRVPVVSKKHPGMAALVDADDVQLVRGKRWNWSSGRPESATGRGNGGSVVWSRHGGASMGRVILGVLDNRDQLVSHANGDKLDCRRANLIVRTRSELKLASRPPKKWELLQPYPDPDRPGVWRVPVRSHKRAMEALIDAADLPVVEGKGWNWSPRSDGAVAGTVVLATTGRQEPLHRMILGLIDPQTRVMFANGDPLDCRRDNLLTRTQAEVSQAARRMVAVRGKACASRFKGVVFDQEREKWSARINKEGLHRQIGRFDNESAAAEAYDDCARVWFGPHAYVNFPDRPLSEQNREWAQRVVEGIAAKEQKREARRKKLERFLKRAARDAKRQDDLRTREEREAMRAAEAAIPNIGRHEARKLFRVSLVTWRRWEKRGWVTCGRRIDGRKMYPLAEIERLLSACGRLRPPYPDPDRPHVIRVPLYGHGIRRREALIDSSSLELIQGGRCTLGSSGGQSVGIFYVNIHFPATGQSQPLRRLITGVADACLQVGHRNGDPLDCRRTNLVVQTVAERCQRSRKMKSIKGKPPTSQFKGVFWDSWAKRWRARIQCDGVTRGLGRFDYEIDAARAYDRAARELFGPHAYLNFPPASQSNPGRLAA